MIAPHDEQAKINHCEQDLETLRRRGGLSPCEALAILDDRKWTAMDLDESHAQLTARIEEYLKQNAYVLARGESATSNTPKPQ